MFMVARMIINFVISLYCLSFFPIIFFRYMYVTGNIDQGGLSEPASSLTEENFRGLERAMFGIPDFPDLNLKVPQEEIKLLCMMLSHVSISLKASPKAFLHCQVANKLAFSLSGELSASKITLDVAVKLIEENCQSFRLLKCDCDAHEVVKQYEIDKSNGEEHSPEKKDLVNLLCVLSTFDSRNDLKDQSGRQCISVSMAYLMKKQGIDLLDCSLKGTFLEVSCAVYNSKTGHIKEFNARCKFLGSLLPAMAIGTAVNAGWAMIKLGLYSLSTISLGHNSTLPTAHAQ